MKCSGVLGCRAGPDQAEGAGVVLVFGDPLVAVPANEEDVGAVEGVAAAAAGEYFVHVGEGPGRCLADVRRREGAGLAGVPAVGDEGPAQSLAGDRGVLGRLGLGSQCLCSRLRGLQPQ